jgi:tetratricopeptide (TPR) repeat protein
MQNDWFGRLKRVSFAVMTCRYCFTIRSLMVCVLASGLTSCAVTSDAVGDPERGGAPPPADVEAKPSSGATDEEVMYRIFAAEVLGSEGDLQGAVGEYLEAALDSDDPAVAMRATRVAFAAQAWQQASMAADRWAFLDPSNVSARESAALAMLATADYAGAELQLAEIVRLTDDKEQAWSLVAGLLGRSANPERAGRVLANLLERSGTEGSATAVHAQSQLAVRAGDVEGAYELAQQAVAMQPDRIEFLAWAGRLALSRGDREAGIDFIRRAWRLEPQDHDLTLAYADLLARDGQEGEARRLLAEMKQTPDVMLTRILFELSANDIPAAMALYDGFREMTFEDPSAKAFYQAQAAESLDLINDAIEFYAIVAEGDFYVPAVARRAELLAMRGDVEEARKTLADLRLQTDPAIIEESWLAEARILQQTGDREGALATLDRALEQFADSIPVRYAHALVAAELGRIDVAERDLRFILVEQPDNAAALNALGYTLADRTERYVEAEELIRRAYALEPNDASITDSMGWVAFRLGRLDEAEQYLSRAWLMENNPEIAAHLGEVLWRQGRLDEAREIWRKGLNVDSGNRTLVETIERLESEL